MKTRLSRLTIVGAAAVAAPFAAAPAAHAATGTAAMQAQPTSSINVPRPAASDPNRQVCRTTRVTGSRFPRQICRSAADQSADRTNQQDAVRDFQHFGASDSQYDNSNTRFGNGSPPSPNR